MHSQVNWKRFCCYVYSKLPQCLKFNYKDNLSMLPMLIHALNCKDCRVEGAGLLLPLSLSSSLVPMALAASSLSKRLNSPFMMLSFNVVPYSYDYGFLGLQPGNLIKNISPGQYSFYLKVCEALNAEMQRQ